MVVVFIFGSFVFLIMLTAVDQFDFPFTAERVRIDKVNWEKIARYSLGFMPVSLWQPV